MSENTQKPAKIDLSSISGKSFSTLSSGIKEPVKNDFGAFDIPLVDIEPDPKQPRKKKNLTLESIKSLADTLHEEGLISPISLREHPEKPGKYMIESGERRYLAAKLLGWRTIASVFSRKFSRARQVIENHQRVPLTTEEMVEFVKEETENGKSLRDIGKRIGMSHGNVAFYRNLIDIKPQQLKAAYEANRIQDLLAINDLISLAKSHEAEVLKFLKDNEGEIARPMVMALKKQLKQPASSIGGENNDSTETTPPQNVGNLPEDGIIHPTEDVTEPEAKVEVEESAISDAPTEPTGKSGKVFIYATYSQQIIKVLAKEPSSKDRAVVQLNDGTETEVYLRDLVLSRIGRE